MRAYAHDLKTFFSIVGKDPVEVRARDVLGFITAQQRARVGAENVARISDGGSGLSVATIRRRLAAVSAFYGYLIACGDAGVETNPVPRGLPTRRRRRDGRGQPLVRAVRRLPRILEPGEVAALMAALRTERDRAMVQAMVLGGLRRCEVLGLRLEDLRLGEWRVFIADGKGGHQRTFELATGFVIGLIQLETTASSPTESPCISAPSQPRRDDLTAVVGPGWSRRQRSRNCRQTCPPSTFEYLAADDQPLGDLAQPYRLAVVAGSSRCALGLDQVAMHGPTVRPVRVRAHRPKAFLPSPLSSARLTLAVDGRTGGRTMLAA